MRAFSMIHNSLKVATLANISKRYFKQLPVFHSTLVYKSTDSPPVYFVRKPFRDFASLTMEDVSGIKPPARVKGMKKWDRDAFNDIIEVPCLLCSREIIDRVRKVIFPYMVKLKQFTSVVDLDNEDENYETHRLILLDPSLVSDFNSFSDDVMEKLVEAGVKEEDLKSRPIAMKLEHWTFTDVIRAVIPDDISETASGFTEVGHIAHFNLREEMLPYKYVIGEALLATSARKIKTVVNKTHTIDNTFRTFQLELLAGKKNYVTQIKESNCWFDLDFSKVYWNSRLGTEHGRVVSETKPGDVLFDVFAGIGPFAIPSAKKNVTVFANDLNPVSYEFLVRNRKKNKISDDQMKAYCLDGREFIQTVVKDELIKLYTEGSVYCEYRVHIVMNLPALAITFVDAFQSLLKGTSLTVEPGHEPIVYCYCFTDIAEATENFNGDTKQEVRARVQKFLPLLSDSDIYLRFVRNVAPKKDMMCVIFVLRNEILFDEDDQEDDEDVEDGEPASKCRKLDD